MDIFLTIGKKLTILVNFLICKISFYYRYLILNLYAFVLLKFQTILCYSHFSCFYAIKGKHIHFTKQCEFLQFLTINQYKLDYKVRNMLMRGCLFVFFLNANIFVKSSLRCCSYCNFECISNRKYLKTQMCEKIDVFIKKLHSFKNANIENPN